MGEVYVGEVTHYYSNIKVAAIELVEPLAVGDVIHFKSPGSREAKVNFEQEVESMQIEHDQVDSAEPGQAVAIKVEQRVRTGDRAYKRVE
jgi:hypothetical protein